MIFAILLISLLISPQISQAQSDKIDVVDYMRAKFDYQGFTEQNSYLAINIHVFDKAQNKWVHYTEQKTCPPEIRTCESTNWQARNMTRQKPRENILYYNKGAIPGVNRVPETFWFDDEYIYDFDEGYANEIFNPEDARDPTLFGLFHNFFVSPEDNPNLRYPNRGYPWSLRYINQTGDNSFPFFGVKIREFKNMQYLRDWTLPAGGITKMFYYPTWDSSKDTWNNQADTGNLPTPLEVVVSEQSNKDDKGLPIFMEKYFYAKNGQNSFGIIRYERWNRKEEVCGNTDCCTTQTCQNNLALVNYNTFNYLSHYDQGEDPDQYFTTSYYSDPKIEKYPGTPSNGSLPRGQFKLTGDGQTTDSQTLKSGDWVQLTSILTDADYMISEELPNRHCPDGYHYLGSIATNFVNHQQKDKGYGWAEFCGTNKNVLLATSCPVNYESRASFTNTDAFDYLGNNVSGQKLNYCVHYNEFHFPKKALTISGDYNNDQKVDLIDFDVWKTNYLNKQMSLVDFSLWKTAYLQSHQ